MKTLKDLYAFGFCYGDDASGRNEIRADEVKEIVDLFKRIKLTSDADGRIPNKNITRGVSSYGLKHVVERARGKYCSNGHLIQAMHEYGFKWEHCKGDSPNALFNASKKQVRYLSSLKGLGSVKGSETEFEAIKKSKI